MHTLMRKKEGMVLESRAKRSTTCDEPRKARDDSPRNGGDGRCFAVALYSARRAEFGFTCIARRAGITHAATATAVRVSATSANVRGSVVLTP